jgi:hypothetical protein
MMVLKVNFGVPTGQPKLEQPVGMGKLSAALVIDRHGQKTDGREDGQKPSRPAELVCKMRQNPHAARLHHPRLPVPMVARQVTLARQP